MRPARVVIAILLALVGLVWALQGLDVIGGSAMSGTPFWAVVGVGLMVGAIAIVAAEVRRRDGTGGSDADSGGTGEPPAA